VQDQAIHEEDAVLCVALPRYSGAARALSLAPADRAVDDHASQIRYPVRDRFGRSVELTGGVGARGKLPLLAAPVEIRRRELAFFNGRRLLRLCDDAGEKRRRERRAERRDPSRRS